MEITGSSIQKKKKILVVEDEEIIRNLIKQMCGKSNYEVIEAENGQVAIELAITENPDLVMMDVVMPVMDGFTALTELKKREETKYIPVIIITALDSNEDRIKGISIGANDFLLKPFNSVELLLRIKNNLQIKEHQDFLKRHSLILEEQIEERTRELRLSFSKLEEAHKQIKDGYIDTIYRLVLASEYKDEDTGAHIMRIGYYAKELAEALGMDKEFTDTIYYSAAMHDIGKVSIPDVVLLKSGPLTSEEFEIMKKHTTIGGRILSGSKSPFLQIAEEIALSHHERWDGSGYPAGLCREEIPIPGRIMNIADQYDALRAKRPYKPAFEHCKTTQIIINGDGRTIPSHFCPDILEAFKKLQNRFNEIFEEHKDEKFTPFVYPKFGVS